MTINQKILDFIKSNRISQAGLAKELKYDRSNLNRILSSDDLKVSQLEDICKALKIPVSYFFDGISTKEIEDYKKQIFELETRLEDKTKLIPAYETIMVSTAKGLKNLLEKKETTLTDVKDELKNFLFDCSLFAAAPVVRALGDKPLQTKKETKTKSKK